MKLKRLSFIMVVLMIVSILNPYLVKQIWAVNESEILSSVYMPDYNLELAIREALEKPDGDLTEYDLAQLYGLMAFEANIADLTGLEYAVNLQVLDISDNLIEDITPISNLQNLFALNLNRNLLQELPSILNLPNLQHFWLEENSLTQITPVSELPNLSSLNLGYNNLTELPEFQNYSLLSLNLTSNHISDLSGLVNLVELEALYLYDNQIEDISALANMINLTWLGLSNNRVNNIDALSEMTDLADLRLFNNKVAEITVLSNLLNLNYIELQNNHLTCISPLVTNSYAGGLGQDAVVYIQHNYLDLTDGSHNMLDIEALITAGVTVYYDSQRIKEYEILAEVSPTSSGTVSGEGIYTHGADVTLIAKPNTGYSFMSWTEAGEVVSTESSYNFSATVNRRLVANFAKIEYAVSVSTPGGGTVSGGGTYCYGDSVIVSAIPEIGYHFINWTENDIEVSANNSYSFVVEANRNLVAHFQSYFTWESIEGGVRITGYSGPSGDIVIPDNLGGESVIEIKDKIYWDGVFAEKGLTSVILPSSLTYIGEGAFYNNTLSSISIGNNIQSIGERAFSHNMLSSVDIGDSLTKIGDYAFANNRLTAFTIPNKVTHIGDGTFYVNRLEEIIIPEGVTYIGKSAFRHNRLTSVDIPDGVTYIGVDAFWSNQLDSVKIPNSVTQIGAAAFGINKLTSVQIPDSITTIAAATFRNNRLTTLTIPKSVTTIESHAFTENYLTSIIIPESVTVIDSGAFRSNRLESVTIPESVITIGQGAFENNQSYPEDLIIYGKLGSAAKKYADDHGHTFIEIAPKLVESIIVSGIDGATFIDSDRGTLQMIATVMPEDADAQSVSWSVIPGTGYADIDQSGLLTAKANGTVTVIATAIDDSGVEGSIDILISNQLGYNISAIANPIIGGSIEGLGLYSYGEQVTLIASAKTGYHFISWTEGDKVVSSDSEYTFIVESERNLVANFSPDAVIGDVNGDDTIDVGDAILVLRHIVGLTDFTPGEVKAADVDGNGTVDVGDAILILRYIVGLIDKFPVESKVQQYTVTQVTMIRNKDGTVDEYIDSTILYEEGKTAKLVAPINLGEDNQFRFRSWDINDRAVSYKLEYDHKVTGDATVIRYYSETPDLPDGMVLENGGGILLGVDGELLGFEGGSGDVEKGTTITRDMTSMLNTYQEFYPDKDIIFLYWEKNYEIVSYDSTYTYTCTEPETTVYMYFQATN